MNIVADRGRLVGLGAACASRYEGVLCAWASGSIVEGFGNSRSDLDLFVVTDGPTGQRADGGVAAGFGFEEFRVDLDYTDDIRIDTECWDINRIRAIAAELNGCSVEDPHAADGLNPSWFQLAHGIRVGWPVLGEVAFADLRRAFDWTHLCHLQYCRFVMQHAASAEDAVGAIQAGDAGTSLLTSRLALGSAADALLAAVGSTNPKPKWRFAKLRQYGLLEVAERYLLAELDSAADPAAVLASSKQRLRLAGDLAVRAAQEIGRLAKPVASAGPIE